MAYLLVSLSLISELYLLLRAFEVREVHACEIHEVYACGGK